MFYNKFAVGPASSQYQLSISGFSGIASDDPFLTRSIDYMKFTTKDRDNDLASSINCAISAAVGIVMVVDGGTKIVRMYI